MTYTECGICGVQYLSESGKTKICHNCRKEMKRSGDRVNNTRCLRCGTGYHSATMMTKLCPECRIMPTAHYSKTPVPAKRRTTSIAKQKKRSSSHKKHLNPSVHFKQVRIDSPPKRAGSGSSGSSKYSTKPAPIFEATEIVKKDNYNQCWKSNTSSPPPPIFREHPLPPPPDNVMYESNVHYEPIRRVSDGDTYDSLSDDIQYEQTRHINNIGETQYDQHEHYFDGTSGGKSNPTDVYYTATMSSNNGSPRVAHHRTLNGWDQYIPQSTDDQVLPDGGVQSLYDNYEKQDEGYEIPSNRNIWDHNTIPTNALRKYGGYRRT